MTDKTILVTGGAGFIGSQLVDRLLARKNCRVVVIDDFNDFYSPDIKHKNIEAQLANDNFQLFELDICDREKIEIVFEQNNFDVIVHLAARAGVRPSLTNPRLYARTNIDGTLALLELARRFHVPQFVFGSSSSVYGINEKVPFSEADAVQKPVSPYAATKAAGELLCHTYAHLYGLRCICLRFFTVYGARQRPDLAISKFVRLISENKPIPVFGDGRTRRDYTFIEDILDGIEAAMRYRDSLYEIVNLGESRTVELLELIGIIEKCMQKKAILNFLPAQAGDVPQTYADITKAARLLDYHPRTAIEDGIRAFVQWFERQEASRGAESIARAALS